MPTRRQEKVARVVKEAVSNAIANHLNDPRIVGFVSVTRVEMAADLRNADVYISIFGGDPILQKDGKTKTSKNAAVQNRTFEAITHAKNRIQAMVAGKLQSKFCPVLCFHKDEKFKKTLEIINLIDQAVSQLKKEDLPGQEED